MEALPFLVLVDHRGEVRHIKRGYPEESLPGPIGLMNGLQQERALALAASESKAKSP